MKMEELFRYESEMPALGDWSQDAEGYFQYPKMIHVDSKSDTAVVLLRHHTATGIPGVHGLSVVIETWKKSYRRGYTYTPELLLFGFSADIRNHQQHGTLAWLYRSDATHRELRRTLSSVLSRGGSLHFAGHLVSVDDDRIEWQSEASRSEPSTKRART